MTTGILAGFGSAAVLVLVALYIGLVATTVILPFALVSVARSLRGIQRELECLNRGRPAATPAPDHAAPATPEPIMVPDMGHRLLR